MSRLSLYVNDRGKCVTHYSGFSWLAGLVPAVWALQRRLFRVAVLLLIVSIAFSALAVRLTPGLLALLYLLQLIVFGSLANRLHRLLLERGRWLLTAEESAPSPGKQP